MKKINFRLLIVLSVLATGFTLSCTRELIDIPQSSSLTVEQAKAWFEERKVTPISMLKSSKTGKTKDCNPDWGKAFAENNKDYEAVETPLTSQTGFTLSTEENMELGKKNNEPGFLTSLSHMVIHRNRKTGIKECFIMTIIGDTGYLKTKNFQLSNNSYLRKDKDFSGYVLFHNLDGTFENGWRYKKGKVNGRMSLTSSPKASYRQKIAVVPMDCITINVYEITAYFTDFYSGGISLTVSNGYSMNYLNSFQICDNSNEYNDLNAGYYGNSEINIYKYKPSSSYLDSLLGSKSSLSNDQMRKLDLIFLKLEEKCLYKAMFHGLIVKRTKLDFTMSSSIGHPAQYSNNAIKFQNDASFYEDAISEELFHAFQDKVAYPNGVDSYISANFEFEAKLLRDILNITKGGCCMTITRVVGDDQVTNYNKWLLDWLTTYSSRQYPSSIEELMPKYYDYMKLFMKCYPEYVSPINENLEPKAINLLLSSSNCTVKF